MPRLKVTIITGRSLSQGRSKELGKFSDKYRESVAVCELDPKDLRALRIRPGTNVRIRTKYGKVVLKAVKSTQSPHRGIVFLPYGPWASVIMGAETQGTGMPSFKGVPGRIEPARKESVSDLRQLLGIVER